MSKSVNGSSLITNLLTKSTDTHQYFHATLCHRSVCKKSVLYGHSNEADLFK